MLQWLKDLFAETSGVSAMRVMAMISLLFSCCLAAYGVHEAKDVTTQVGLFLGAAFGGKIVQKGLE